jgi:hypothetical protein
MPRSNPHQQHEQPAGLDQSGFRRFAGRLGIGGKVGREAETAEPVDYSLEAVLSRIEAGLDRGEVRSSYYTSPDARKSGVQMVLAEVTDFLDAAPDHGKQVEDVVLRNSYKGMYLPPRVGKEVDVYDELAARSHFLKIAQRDPVLAEKIVRHQLTGFHGTRSGVLSSILQHGLMPEQEVREREGLQQFAGERTYSPEGGQPRISFVSWSDLSNFRHYSGHAAVLDEKALGRIAENLQASIDEYDRILGADNTFSSNFTLRLADVEQQMQLLRAEPDSSEVRRMVDNYPIMIGADLSGFKKYGSLGLYEMHASRKEKRKPLKDKNIVITREALSDVASEHAVYGTIPAEAIRVLAVPSDHIAEVEALVRDGGLDVYVADLGTLQSDVAQRRAKTTR